MKVGAVSLVIPDIRPDTRRIDQKPEYFAIRKCLSKLDAQVVDLEGPLSEALTSDSTSPVIFEHDLHWTPHGHGIVGRTVAWAPVHL